ncbi:MAG: hypothetical protein LBD06_10035, partial [Candidatus Accumulibacter sp.]|nr:hypothetical protein [Accumulibacter sp.]
CGARASRPPRAVPGTETERSGFPPSPGATATQTPLSSVLYFLSSVERGRLARLVPYRGQKPSARASPHHPARQRRKLLCLLSSVLCLLSSVLCPLFSIL